MSRTFSTIIALVAVVATASGAERHRLGTFDLVRVKAIYSKMTTHVATMRGLIDQPMPDECTASPKLAEAWNTQTQRISRQVINCEGFTFQLKRIVADNAVTTDEQSSAASLLSRLQKVPESESRKIGLGCKSGGKYSDVFCHRDQIATDIWWWVLTECPND